MMITPKIMYSAFLGDFSPSAFRAHDMDIALWKTLSRDPTLPQDQQFLSSTKWPKLSSNKEGTPVEKILEATEWISTHSASSGETSAAFAPEEAFFIREAVSEDKDPLPPLGVDFAMKGQNGPTSLSQVFKKEYAVIDLSQRFCNPCLNLAADKNRDIVFQEKITKVLAILFYLCW